MPIPAPIEVLHRSSPNKLRLCHGDFYGNDLHGQMQIQIEQDGQSAYIDLRRDQVDSLVEQLTAWINEECCNA